MQGSVDDRLVRRLNRLPSATALCDARIAIIDERVLLRECLAKGVEAAGERLSAQCFSTVEEWRESPRHAAATSLILLCTGARRAAAAKRELEMLAKDSSIPVIWVSDHAYPEEIQEGLQLGVRGFLPTTVDLHLAVQVMQLVRAGGVYVPASILVAPQRLPPPSVNPENEAVQGLLTRRQIDVVEAVRQGKPNKIIAHELSMRESTVKVHLRRIMKKLNARNRTEVAYMATKRISRTH
jgi:DNA-binding NarL/FixJ family response regulator